MLWMDRACHQYITHRIGLLHLKAGPRTHYGSIKNDIGHMRITDRRTNDGEKIMFVEEMQSDWSQKRALCRHHKT